VSSDSPVGSDPEYAALYPPVKVTGVKLLIVVLTCIFWLAIARVVASGLTMINEVEELDVLAAASVTVIVYAVDDSVAVGEPVIAPVEVLNASVPLDSEGVML
jgi:hypothetical protein